MSRNQYISKKINQTNPTGASWVVRWVITTIAFMVATSSLTALVMIKKLGYMTKAEYEKSLTWDPSGLTTVSEIEDVITVTAPSEAIYWSGDDLHIEGNKLADGFNAFNWGTKTKLLAYKDDSGQILTAFSTCQTCYNRGEITFSIIDGLLHCSGCSTTQNPDIFGTASWGGCKPIAVPSNYREDSDELTIVPKEVFLYAASMFAEWDKGDFTTTFATYTSNQILD